MIHDSVQYLERNQKCSKHHVGHTGSNAYLLDFYTYLGEIEKGKKFVFELLDLIVDSPDGGRVFYPGHLNPMNMSQNVIDTGTAVDAIARFVFLNKEHFSDDEHKEVKQSLKEVVETYLAEAACSKKITNQRLWGLTGVASYARYVGEEKKYLPVARESLEKAFSDMTVDGFFRYYPDPEKHSRPYDSMTTFYQSRHTTFMQYALESLGLDASEYTDRLQKSVDALLSMYLSNGTKDMRMECKRWYWLSPYEVASHAFDAYALAHSENEASRAALHNVLFQTREHFFDGFLHSHKGVNANFQCPIFWTAHLAWLCRIPNIENLFEKASKLTHFSYTFRGKEVFTHTDTSKRVMVNSLLHERNPTTGIFENGLPGRGVWRAKIPKLPHAFLFSVREVVNHARAALRGLHFFEAITRLSLFAQEALFMFLPYYSVRYGKVEDLQYTDSEVVVKVKPGSKYGTVLDSVETVTIPL